MGKLTVYTTDTCAYCVMVKKFLDTKKIEYDVVNLSKYPERRQECYDVSGAMTVPVTTDGKNVVVGWNPGKLVAMLA